LIKVSKEDHNIFLSLDLAPAPPPPRHLLLAKSIILLLFLIFLVTGLEYSQ
jgi:hypothetical protein